MSTLQMVTIAAFLALGVVATLPAAAQSYPARPIRFIVPSAPGGTPDINARLLATELTRQMGQQIVVDNRPGAASSIGTELIVRSAPDGYTIGYGTVPALAINQTLYPKLPHDPEKDLQKVAQLGYQPNLLAVAPLLPVKSVKELIAYAKSYPNKLSYGSSGNGTTLHLGMELFKLMTGTQMLHVPFKAAVIAITDLTAGRVQVMADNINSIGPHVKANRLRGLAVTSATRVPAFSNLPTVAEAGVPGFDVAAWAGVVVPAGVPKAIVTRLNTELNKALAAPAVADKLPDLGLQVVGGTPEAFSAHIRKETARWADVVKRSGAKME